MKISGLSCITKKIFLVFLGHPNDDGRIDGFVRTLRNFFVLCTFGEELELESTVKKISYFIFIYFGGSLKKNLLSFTYEI